jgi:hypothetical protein
MNKEEWSIGVMEHWEAQGPTGLLAARFPFTGFLA